MSKCNYTLFFSKMLLFCIPAGTKTSRWPRQAPPGVYLSTGFTQASTSYPQAAMLARVLHRENVCMP